MAKKNNVHQYFAGGNNEKKIINTLKAQKLIPTGKVSIFNIIQNELTNARLRDISNETIIYLVFNTDIQNNSTFIVNLEKLIKLKTIKAIILIPQNKNLEEELIRCTSINNIQELLNSKPTSDFKTDLNNCTNIYEKLLSKDFNPSILWKSELSSNCVFYKYIVTNLPHPKLKKYI